MADFLPHALEAHVDRLKRRLKADRDVLIEMLGGDFGTPVEFRLAYTSGSNCRLGLIF